MNINITKILKIDVNDEKIEEDKLIEVEVKAKIDQLTEVKNKLNEINAVKIGKEYQKDMYFNSPTRDFAKTDEALRIRKISTKKDKKMFITYKGPKIDNSSKTREEIEVAIDDAVKIAKIFENLSFSQVREVVKNRTIYKLEDYIISLDDVEGLPHYMEIEVDLEDGSDFQPTLDRIFETFQRLGIVDGFERNSYLELLENNSN